MKQVASIVQITGQIANDNSSKDSSDYKGIIALGNGLILKYMFHALGASHTATSPSINEPHA